MKDNLILTAILIDDDTQLISNKEVCQLCEMSEDMLREWIEQGLFTQHLSLQDIEFDQKMLARIQVAMRLHRELEINPSGVVFALDLLDELKQLRNELEILHHHLGHIDN